MLLVVFVGVVFARVVDDVLVDGRHLEVLLEATVAPPVLPDQLSDDVSDEEEAEVGEPDDPDDLVGHRQEEPEPDVGEPEVDGAVPEEAVHELPHRAPQRLAFSLLWLRAATVKERVD